MSEQKYDLLLIESSGISEPMPVAATFTTEDAEGLSLQRHFLIDNMVSKLSELQHDILLIFVLG